MAPEEALKATSSEAGNDTKETLDSIARMQNQLLKIQFTSLVLTQVDPLA